jgi:short-subunit dehydrogenase
VLECELPNRAIVRQLDVANTHDSISTPTELIEKMADVNLIVFAAGAGDLNENREWEMECTNIATNVAGFTAVANISIKYFINKRSGPLVAISLVAGIRGGRASLAYNASKAFISNYLEGLPQKVTHIGLPITITDIQPGFVDTSMAKGDGLFWVASAKEEAKQIYSAINTRKSHAYVTKRWWLIAWLLRVMPDTLYNRL